MLSSSQADRKEAEENGSGAAFGSELGSARPFAMGLAPRRTAPLTKEEKERLAQRRAMREAKLAADPYIIKGDVKAGSEFDTGLEDEEAAFERERALEVAAADEDGPSPEISALMKTMEEYAQSSKKNRKKIVYKVDKGQLDVAREVASRGKVPKEDPDRKEKKKIKTDADVLASIDLNGDDSGPEFPVTKSYGRQTAQDEMRKLNKKKKYRLRGRSSETAKAHRG
eukprot:TRINITY_DN1019_c0_g1_i2.p1 TRINITY_DN1019_c0_g1~~TRINITY_DN1019_c0_g1_i2.p1  ORF type:complete len:234 (+),score=64.38 TRINITY_DN1019_c0_g1_i2:25-702(+)